VLGRDGKNLFGAWVPAGQMEKLREVKMPTGLNRIDDRYDVVGYF
jgi:hypothetical protein